MHSHAIEWLLPVSMFFFYSAFASTFNAFMNKAIANDESRYRIGFPLCRLATVPWRCHGDAIVSRIKTFVQGTENAQTTVWWSCADTPLGWVLALLKMPFGKPLQNVLSRRVSGYEWWFEKKNQNKKCLISEKDFCWQWEQQLKPASNECLPYGEAYVLMYFKYSLGQPTLPKSLFCSNVKHVDDGFVDWWVSTALIYFIIRK